MSHIPFHSCPPFEKRKPPPQAKICKTPMMGLILPKCAGPQHPLHPSHAQGSRLDPHVAFQAALFIWPKNGIGPMSFIGWTVTNCSPPTPWTLLSDDKEAPWTHPTADVPQNCAKGETTQPQEATCLPVLFIGHF